MIKKIAIVMTYRHSPARERRIPKLCVNAWLEMTNPDAIVFVDGSEDKLELCADDRVVHIHKPYSGTFNLSFMRNVGVRKAINLGYDYIQVMDTDIFPTSEAYFDDCKGLMRNIDILKPMVANPDRVEIGDFDSVSDSTYQDFISLDLQSIKRRRFSYSTIFAKKEVFEKINGFPEVEIRGWGAEDDFFIASAKMAGFKIAGLPNHKLYHSWHEPDTMMESKEKTNQYEKNVMVWRELLARKRPHIRNDDLWGLRDVPEK